MSNSIFADNNQTSPAPITDQPTSTTRLEITVTLQELQIVQSALSYYSNAMRDTGEEVAETIGKAEAELWHAKVEASAAVLMDVNRIIASDRARRIRAEEKTATATSTKPDPHTQPGRSSQTATAARLIDNVGKCIAVILVIFTLWSALATATTPPIK